MDSASPAAKHDPVDFRRPEPIFWALPRFAQAGTGVARYIGVEPSIDTDALRYLKAEQVNTPAGSLDHAVVVGSTGERLGNLDGIVIDPAERRASYLVVSARRMLKTHRYLLPLAPSTSRIVQEQNPVQVQVDRDDLRYLPELPASGIASFSDADLITALFSSPPA